MTLVLGLRHGLVENPDGLVYGRLPGFPLSEEGLERARSVGQLLAEAPIRAVHSSPLERARQTAQAIAEPHGLDVVVDDRLVEWVGRDEWEGLVWKDLVATEEYIRLGADPVGLAPANPLDQVGERVLAWARQAAEAHDDGVVVGVSHEAPLAAAVLVGSGRPLSEYRSLHIPHLSGIRMVPEPPEPVDLSEALHGG